MDFKRLFKALPCFLLIVFEDDFDNTGALKNHLMRDFTCMDLEDQAECINCLRESYPAISSSLEAFASVINPAFLKITNWHDEVLRDDFNSALPVIENVLGKGVRESIETAYANVEDSKLREAYSILSRYGLGVNIPSSYERIFSEYIECENRRNKLRIYSNFTSDVRILFENEIAKSSNERIIVCIIDNCLKDSYRAEEILSSIRGISDKSSNVIGSVFTSKETVEQVDRQLCFVYTKKSEANLLPVNIARSAYHYFLNCLQIEFTQNMNDAFDKAKANKFIASFLSARANREGISDYQVIQNWVRLLYDVQSSKSNATRKMISLSHVIGELYDANTDDEENQDQIFSQEENLNEINIWEAFDYRVNEYCEPTMPGDVFLSESDGLFILIGQDCDMMMAENRTRRTVIGELLPVELISMDFPDKIKNDLENVWINNFKYTDEKQYCMKVDYQHRKYIDSRIMDLCSYNLDGKCQIDLSKALEDELIMLLQNHQIVYRDKLVEAFSAIDKLNMSESAALRIMLENKHYVVSMGDYVKQDNRMVYNLRRICRIRQTYVFYLYKLYLEYRGRQPFETINYTASMTRTIVFSYKEAQVSIDVQLIMGPYSDERRAHHLKWYIASDEIKKMLQEFGIKSKFRSDGKLISLTKIKTEIKLDNEHVLTIEKKSKNKAIISCTP